MIHRLHTVQSGETMSEVKIMFFAADDMQTIYERFGMEGRFLP